MYTEEEAEAKKCPASMSGTTYCTCIASACMAWRWCTEENNDAMEYFDAVAPRGEPDIACIPPKPVGFCGLAGRPE